jgi:hypothetical protein
MNIERDQGKTPRDALPVLRRCHRPSHAALLRESATMHMAGRVLSPLPNDQASALRAAASPPRQASPITTSVRGAKTILQAQGIEEDSPQLPKSSRRDSIDTSTGDANASMGTKNIERDQGRCPVMHSPCIVDARTSHAAKPTLFRGTHLHPATDDLDSVRNDYSIISPTMPWEMTPNKLGNACLSVGGKPHGSLA